MQAPALYSIHLLLMVFTSASPALASAAPTPSAICELLLKNSMLTGSAVFISSNDATVFKSSSARTLANSGTEKNLSFHAMLARIPFAEKIMREVPALGILDWTVISEQAYATFEIKQGNLISIILDDRGLLEIRIGGSVNQANDAAVFEKVIGLLQANGGEAMLFGRTYVFPKDPADGFELWLTRLDGNNSKTLLAMNEILVYLSTH